MSLPAILTRRSLCFFVRIALRNCVTCLWTENSFSIIFLACNTSCFDMLRNWGRHKFASCSLFFWRWRGKKNYFVWMLFFGWEISLLMLCIRCEACLLHSTFAFSKYFSSSSYLLSLTLPKTMRHRENCLINVLGNNLWPSSDRYTACFLPKLNNANSYVYICWHADLLCWW